MGSPLRRWYVGYWHFFWITDKKMLKQNTAERRPRGRPRSQASVVDSTLALIRAHGVKNLTMEAIADHAGISKITLYRRWTSKAVLLADALFEQIQVAIPLEADVNPIDAISRHVSKFAEELKGDIGDLLRQIIAEYLGDPAALQDFRKHYLGLRRKTAIELIDRGQKEGRFAARGKPEALHDALYGALFYRFLFGVGALDQGEALLLVATILQPQR